MKTENLIAWALQERMKKEKIEGVITTSKNSANLKIPHGEFNISSTKGSFIAFSKQNIIVDSCDVEETVKTLFEIIK